MRCIAIPFELNEAWIGGSYYIRNLCSAMALLPESEQPFILLVCEQQDSVSFIQGSGYRHIGWVRPKEFDELAEAGNTDVVFPHSIDKQESRTISWIPDFQELHLGYFFTNQEIANRRNHHRRRFATAGLIVSSEDVRKDVDLFYPGECQKIAVVRFASFDLPDLALIDEIRLKYKLTGRYVICANQVWLHKNHIVVIRAVALLKERNINVTVVFTGNETDYRVAGYTEFLKRQAVEWGVADRVRFLGFIPRGDQLCLMKGAFYVLQPSLFEGWSTVIEDAKAMGKFVVASDLDVHKEQLTEASRFFFRHDPVALADAMAELTKFGSVTERTIDYTEAQIRFAHDFMRSVQKFLPVNSDFDNKNALASIRTLSNANLSGKAQNEANALPQKPHSNVAESKKIKLAQPLLEANKSLPTGINDQVGVLVQDSVVSNHPPGRFCIEIDHRSDTFNVLKISSDRRVQLNIDYEKFIIRLVQIRSVFHVELRLDSITPAIMLTDNNCGQDGYDYFISIPLRISPSGSALTGRVKKLSSASLEDVNIALEAGVAHLLQKATMYPNSIPDGLKFIMGGVRLYTENS